MRDFFDDGNYRWEYKCKYEIPTNDSKDYYYHIAFETEDGGYMSGGELECYYYNEENILTISKDRSRVKFYVENFHDIHQILKPLIKGHKAVIYPIYKSISEERKEKINNINKKH